MDHDYTTDQNPRAFFHLEQKGVVPDFVKQASIPGTEDVQNLPDEMFGDRAKRLFPLHTKEAAYLSAAYYLGENPEPGADGVWSRIKSAAEFHGIEEEIVHIQSTLTTVQTKEASTTAPTGYALSVDFGEDQGGVQYFYPIQNHGDVEKSAFQISKDYHEGRLVPELFRNACTALVKAAKDLSVSELSIPRSVMEAGTERTPDFDRARMYVRLRKSAHRLSDENVQLYMDLVDGAEAEYETKSASYQELDEAMVKWAEAMLFLDRRLGIEKYDHDQVVDPYRAIFSGVKIEDLEKTASETVFVGEAAVPLSAIRAIPEDVVSRRFTKDEAEDIGRWQKEASAFEINRDLGLKSEAFLDDLLRQALKYG